MTDLSSRRGLVSPILLLAGVTAVGAFSWARKGQDPVPSVPTTQRVEMIASLHSLEATMAKMAAQMELQTASLKQLEKINGALLQLVYKQANPPLVNPHLPVTPPGPPSKDNVGPR